MPGSSVGPERGRPKAMSRSRAAESQRDRQKEIVMFSNVQSSLSTAAALLLAVCCVAAPSSAAGMASNTSSVAPDDRSFAQKAQAAGMGEVEMGKLAQQKAQADQVKSFGARMVQDHSKANDKLKQIAGAEGVQLPAKLDKSAETEIDKLQKLSGAEFDAEYMKHQVSGHKKVIKEFEEEAKSGKNADIKRFATDTLPTLREHLKLAQSAEAAAMKESRNEGTPGLKAAKKATGATHVAAEHNERMPVPKTGM
jgi:putative membrane protein